MTLSLALLFYYSKGILKDLTLSFVLVDNLYFQITMLTSLISP